MNDFINKLGKDNLTIIIAIIILVILALIVILIIEKYQNKKKNNYKLDFYEEEIVEKPTGVVYYKQNVTEEEAKQKLDEAAKKLAEEDEFSDTLITHTNFEIEQEEKSVISYEELIKVSGDVDERNDNLLKDEGTEPITLEELYKKHLEEQEQEDSLDNPIFVEETKEDENKKFKNSEVISPVFGVYKNVTKTKYTTEELEKTVDLEDLEQEIRKTEEFLRELKKLKDKLD